MSELQEHSPARIKRVNDAVEITRRHGEAVSPPTQVENSIEGWQPSYDFDRCSDLVIAYVNSNTSNVSLRV